MKNCPICSKSYGSLDKHHIHPLEYGGAANGPMVSLCAACHKNLHYQADSIVQGIAKDYFLDSQLENAKPYIEKIIKHRLEFEQNGKAVDSRNRTMIGWSKDQLKTLHLLKVDAGYTSLERFLRDIILDYARRQGYKV